jgi:hypothetical protein
VRWPNAWQLFVDETHSGDDYYTSSERVDGVGPVPPDGWDPAGPWEPLGNGEWRRPIVRHVPAKDDK